MNQAKEYNFKDINNSNNYRGKLSANALKIIAIFAMTLDHIASTFITNEIVYTIFRTIGKLTAPIFWFFIAEGFYKTKNLKKYFLRLIIFAILSHFPYMLLFYNNLLPFKHSFLNQTSVLWGLLCGLSVLYIWNHNNLKQFPFIKITLCLFCCFCAFWADWGILSPVAIWILGTNTNKNYLRYILLAVVIIVHSIIYTYLNLNYIIHFATLLAIPLMLQYSGKKSNLNIKNIKWLFYFYYPIHLLILYFLKWLIL